MKAPTYIYNEDNSVVAMTLGYWNGSDFECTTIKATDYLPGLQLAYRLVKECKGQPYQLLSDYQPLALEAAIAILQGQQHGYRLRAKPLWTEEPYLFERCRSPWLYSKNAVIHLKAD